MRYREEEKNERVKKEDGEEGGRAGYKGEKQNKGFEWKHVFPCI
jgi:hypothetical protein